MLAKTLRRDREVLAVDVAGWETEERRSAYEETEMAESLIGEDPSLIVCVVCPVCQPTATTGQQSKSHDGVTSTISLWFTESCHWFLQQLFCGRSRQLLYIVYLTFHCMNIKPYICIASENHVAMLAICLSGHNCTSHVRFFVCFVSEQISKLHIYIYIYYSEPVHIHAQCQADLDPQADLIVKWI